MLTEAKRCPPFVDVFVWVCVMSVAVKKNASPSGQHGEVGMEKTTQTVLYW